MTAIHLSPSDIAWTLTEFGQGLEQRRTFNLPLPECVVGRGAAVGMRIDHTSVSKTHARLFLDAGTLYVEDLGSTNGTFLNGKRIECSALAAGDLLQFANALFRLGCERSELGERGELGDGTMEEGPSQWAQTLLTFDRLMSERAVRPHFQPIVTMGERETVAFELLARSDLDDLKNPAAMFGAAERLGQQASLSELMRDEGSRVASMSDHPSIRYFYNIHPIEFGTERLVDSLRQLRERYPDLPITIEVHEGAVTELATMRRFREQLVELKMQLAYDDFGAGQGRLVELTEAPADVLKFDMQLIRDIDRAPANRQSLLRSLVEIATDSGTVPLAEGVETAAEHETCRQLGFELGQGFHYGRPQPLD